MRQQEGRAACIKYYKTNPFYLSREWRHLRAEILAQDKEACQICKAKGLYTHATYVHHVNYLALHPELALSKFYLKDGVYVRNLITVCKNCHETVCHPERLRHTKPPLTEERW